MKKREYTAARWKCSMRECRRRENKTCDQPISGPQVARQTCEAVHAEGVPVKGDESLASGIIEV